MARRRLYHRDRYTLPGSVVDIVKSICADYERRRRVMEHVEDEQVCAMCLMLNGAIDTALSEVEEGLRGDLLSDLAEGRGYERSAAADKISKNAYYNRRRKLVYDIAHGLALLHDAN